MDCIGSIKVWIFYDDKIICSWKHTLTSCHSCSFSLLTPSFFCFAFSWKKISCTFLLIYKFLLRSPITASDWKIRILFKYNVLGCRIKPYNLFTRRLWRKLKIEKNVCAKPTHKKYLLNKNFLITSPKKLVELRLVDNVYYS